MAVSGLPFVTPMMAKFWGAGGAEWHCGHEMSAPYGPDSTRCGASVGGGAGAAVVGGEVTGGTIAAGVVGDGPLSVGDDDGAAGFAWTGLGLGARCAWWREVSTAIWRSAGLMTLTGSWMARRPTVKTKSANAIAVIIDRGPTTSKNRPRMTGAVVGLPGRAPQLRASTAVGAKMTTLV